MHTILLFFFFFFNDTATTEIYTLSLHDALPICRPPVPLNRNHLHRQRPLRRQRVTQCCRAPFPAWRLTAESRSEEHTSELQSRLHLVCRLLLEKKKEKYEIIVLARQRKYDCQDD